MASKCARIRDELGLPDSLIGAELVTEAESQLEIEQSGTLMQRIDGILLELGVGPDKELRVRSVADRGLSTTTNTTTASTPKSEWWEDETAHFYNREEEMEASATTAERKVTFHESPVSHTPIEVTSLDSASSKMASKCA